MHYNAEFYDDMGHLMIKNYNKFPNHIKEYLTKYIEKKYIITKYKDTRDGKYQIRYYELIDGCNKIHTYFYGNDTITIKFNL
jgi:hypothetical protein